MQFKKIQRSAQWLADHFEEVPLYLFPFSQHDPTGGSIYPAVWSAMLAARGEGVGSCLTALLQFFHPAETFEILGVPTDRGWHLSGTVSFGYPTGRWGVARRRPVHEVTYRNTWHERTLGSWPTSPCGRADEVGTAEGATGARGQRAARLPVPAEAPPACAGRPDDGSAGR